MRTNDKKIMINWPLRFGKSSYQQIELTNRWNKAQYELAALLGRYERDLYLDYLDNKYGKDNYQKLNRLEKAVNITKSGDVDYIYTKIFSVGERVQHKYKPGFGTISGKSYSPNREQKFLFSVVWNYGGEVYERPSDLMKGSIVRQSDIFTEAKITQGSKDQADYWYILSEEEVNRQTQPVGQKNTGVNGGHAAKFQPGQRVTFNHSPDIDRIVYVIKAPRNVTDNYELMYFCPFGTDNASCHYPESVLIEASEKNIFQRNQKVKVVTELTLRDRSSNESLNLNSARGIVKRLDDFNFYQVDIHGRFFTIHGDALEPIWEPARPHERFFPNIDLDYEDYQGN